MSIVYNTSIVRDGLVLNLDAANVKSYPGSGSTWYDISGNGRNATVVGTSAWTSANLGKFDFGNTSQTSDYIVLPISALQQTSEAYTLEFVMQPLGVGTYYFSSGATSANDNYFLMAHNGSSMGPNDGGNYIPYSNNEILQFTLRRSLSDTGELYKNGSLVTTNPYVKKLNVVEGWILNQEQDTVGGTFDPGQNYRGAFMSVRLYNRALSTSEISQNFEAIRGRYGI